MADEPESLVLEHLRHIREGQRRIEQKLDRLNDRVGELTTRVGYLEGHWAEMSRRIA